MKRSIRIQAFVFLIIFLLTSVLTCIKPVSAQKDNLPESENVRSDENIESMSEEISEETVNQQEKATEEEIKTDIETTKQDEQQTTILTDKVKEVAEAIKALRSENQDFAEKVLAVTKKYNVLNDEEKNLISEEIEKILEEAQVEVGKINHRDIATGITVNADSLPWYVQVKIEAVDVGPAQAAFDEKYKAMLEEYYNDNDDEYYDENYADEYYDEDVYDYEDDDYEYYNTDEDDYDYEEDYEEDYVEDYEDDYDESVYDDADEEYSEDEIYYDGYKVLYLYDITLYDTLLEKEYQLEQGQKAVVSIPLSDRVNYCLNIFHFTDQNEIETITSTNFENRIEFEAEHFSKYGVYYNPEYSCDQSVKGANGLNIYEEENNYSISPKTGYDLGNVILVIVISFLMISVSIVIIKKV